MKTKDDLGYDFTYSAIGVLFSVGFLAIGDILSIPSYLIGLPIARVLLLIFKHPVAKSLTLSLSSVILLFFSN